MLLKKKLFWLRTVLIILILVGFWNLSILVPDRSSLTCRNYDGLVWKNRQSCLETFCAKEWLNKANNVEDNGISFVTSSRHSFSLCHVPKVASTAWMKAFVYLNRFNITDYLVNLSEDEVLNLGTSLDFELKIQTNFSRNFQNNSITLFDFIEKIKNNQIKDWSSDDVMNFLNDEGKLHSIVMKKFSTKLDSIDGQNQNETIRAVFLRHPFERLVSVYFDKFLNRQDPSFVQSVINYETSGLERLQATLKKLMLGENLRKKVKINFEKFIGFVLHELKTGDRSHGSSHWLPYVDFCGLCSIKYDFIGKVETLESDLEALSCKLSNDFTEVQKVFKTKPNHVTFRTPQTTFYEFSLLKKRIIHELYWAYEKDFKAGGYPFPNEYLKVGSD